MSVRVKAVTLEIQPSTERVNIRQVLVGLNLCDRLTPIEIDTKLLHEDNDEYELELSGSVVSVLKASSEPEPASIEVQVYISEPPARTSPHQPGRPADAERPCSEIPMPGSGECVLKETEEDKQ